MRSGDSVTQNGVQKTDEKCIIVSHYTSTLNIIEAFLKKKNYTYHRLDGCVPLFSLSSCSAVSNWSSYI